MKSDTKHEYMDRPSARPTVHNLAGCPGVKRGSAHKFRPLTRMLMSLVLLPMAAEAQNTKLIGLPSLAVACAVRREITR